MTIRLQPLVHVQDMTPAVAFYRGLGAEVVFGNGDGDFTMLDFDGASLTLLAHPPNPDQDQGLVELNFEADEPLEQVQQRVEQVLITGASSLDSEVTETGWGQQLILRSPDGLLVKINRIDRGRG